MPAEGRPGSDSLALTKAAAGDEDRLAQLWVLLYAVAVLALFYLGILEWPKLRGVETKERVSLELEIIKTAASILGGLFFLGTLYFTWANLTETQKKKPI